MRREIQMGPEGSSSLVQTASSPFWPRTICLWSFGRMNVLWMVSNASRVASSSLYFPLRIIVRFWIFNINCVFQTHVSINDFVNCWWSNCFTTQVATIKMRVRCFSCDVIWPSCRSWFTPWNKRKAPAGTTAYSLESLFNVFRCVKFELKLLSWSSVIVSI